MTRWTWIAAALAVVVVLAVVITIAVRTTLPGHPDASSSPSATPDSTPTPTTTTPANTAIFPGGLYLDPKTHAVAAEARLTQEGKSAEATKILEISGQPTAIWIGDWLTPEKLAPLLAEYRADASKQGKTLVFVTYAIPNRDCGGLSKGGLTSEEYLEWNRTIATSLAGSGAVILVEPDSLAQLSNDACKNESEKRLPVLAQAVDILTTANLTVYLDAGGSNWVQPDVIAERLKAVGVEKTRGFFTNVSNYYRVDEERSYAEKVSALVGNKNYVIDVSRNGNGWQGDWCNPKGAALGQAPHVTAGTTGLDALLWVKHPGDSDGACNGGPKAGVWWETYALDLVNNRDTSK
ncbi:glycoside hydrolase family 6 protein [Glaciihabitans sp. dw_435]|uniref:glycoside hydrolase family 6 protein n=1 Tax=Glaciihabitans sp. dw_435 TaxID=2720081 RepID=UPI001BD25797|nr:glycoside hydrolase family 6 protein [Glaciihabitans sp. dw_435]